MPYPGLCDKDNSEFSNNDILWISGRISTWFYNLVGEGYRIKQVWAQIPFSDILLQENN